MTEGKNKRLPLPHQSSLRTLNSPLSEEDDRPADLNSCARHTHLVLSRLLQLIGLIDRPMSYWLAHQDISSLPKPYRLWKFLKWKWARRGSGAAAQAQQALQDGRLNPYRNWSAMAARNVRELLSLKNRWVARCGRIALRMHRIQVWLQDSFSKSAVPQQQPAAAAAAAAAGGRFAPPPPGTAAPAPLFHHQISARHAPPLLRSASHPSPADAVSTSRCGR